MHIIESRPKWGGAQVPYDDSINSPRLTLLDLSLHANACEFYALEPCNRSLDGPPHIGVRFLNPHKEADNPNRFAAAEGRELIGPATAGGKSSTIMLGAPTRRNPINENLTPQDTGDSTLHCASCPVPYRGRNKIEGRSLIGNILEQVHHSNHRIVIEGHLAGIAPTLWKILGPTPILQLAV